MLLYRLEEEQLVPVAWLQPGASYLFAAAALVAAAPILAQGTPVEAEAPAAAQRSPQQALTSNGVVGERFIGRLRRK